MNIWIVISLMILWLLTFVKVFKDGRFFTPHSSSDLSAIFLVVFPILLFVLYSFWISNRD